MFKSKHQSDIYKFSSLTASTQITGDFISIDDVRIAGHFTGNIKSQQRVVIAKGAIIKGNIEADKITVEGKVFGDLKVKNLIEIQANAQITGNIYTGQITVTPGALINGKIISIKKSN